MVHGCARFHAAKQRPAAARDRHQPKHDGRKRQPPQEAIFIHGFSGVFEFASLLPKNGEFLMMCIVQVKIKRLRF